jgi:hypothetical protein
MQERMIRAMAKSLSGMKKKWRVALRAQRSGKRVMSGESQSKGALNETCATEGDAGMGMRGAGAEKLTG